MSVFLENKYTDTYYRIINQAQLLNRKRGRGVAKHHIIPAHFYIDNRRKEKEEAKRTPGWLPGNPDERSNLVYLTHREHLICHLLLRKMIEKERRDGVIYAAWRMVNYKDEDGNAIKCNSRTYDKIRTEVAETHSKRMKGRTPGNKGKKVTDPEKLANIKDAANNRLVFFLICPHCGASVRYPQYYQYHHDNCKHNPNRDPDAKYGATGTKRSDEQRKNLSKGMTGVKKGPMSQEHKDAISRGGKGVKKSKSNKQKAKEAKRCNLNPKKFAALALSISNGGESRVSIIGSGTVFRLSTFLQKYPQKVIDTPARLCYYDTMLLVREPL